mgnify:FL=1|jgi:hypothetical protein
MPKDLAGQEVIETADAGHRRPLVFFDLSQASGLSGRIVMELFDDIVPKTVENFRSAFPTMVVCPGAITPVG